MSFYERLSNQKVQYWSLTIFLVLVLLFLTIRMLEVNLTCVDENKCLLEQCKDHPFKAPYLELLRIEKENNPNCLY